MQDRIKHIKNLMDKSNCRYVDSFVHNYLDGRQGATIFFKYNNKLNRLYFIERHVTFDDGLEVLFQDVYKRLNRPRQTTPKRAEELRLKMERMSNNRKRGL